MAEAANTDSNHCEGQPHNTTELRTESRVEMTLASLCSLMTTIPCNPRTMMAHLSLSPSHRYPLFSSSLHPPHPPLPSHSPPHFCFPLSCLCPVMSRALFHPPETTSPVTGDRGMGRGRVLYFLLSTCSPLFSFWGEETWVRRGEGLWVGPALRGCIAGRTWREDGLSLISSSTNPSSSLNCVGGGLW